MLRGHLSGHAGAVAVAYVVLSAISVVAIDLRLILIPTSIAVLGLILGGFVVFRPLRTGVVLPWPARENPAEEQLVVIINGQACPFQGYEQDLVVAVRVRHLAELFACCLLASVSLYLILTGKVRETASQIGAFEAEIICICGLLALLTSLRWFTERRFLRLSRVAFGSFLAIDPGFIRQGLAYQFFDQRGERRGGRGPLSRAGDTAVLVLYWPRDADVNVPHGAFAFHNFQIGLLPGRRKVAVQAGVEG